MKNQLITITYHVGQWIETAQFIRPAGQDKPTWQGAARMIAKGKDCKAGDVSIERIETAMFA